ncbi:MAG: putative transporter [Candidatus Hydrogenedentes bacterium]|nr:putative transporter [Candidatus Hydrogenedentota bacterium]
MLWFAELFQGESVASSILILSLVAGTGIALGSLRLKGIGLGIAGVLFSGLLFGHFQFAINHEVMEFAREFGLILFVYTIGLQVGPGFLASLRREGLPLNLMAASIVILGSITAVVISYAAGIEIPVVVGLLSGATTNTPSLAAAQQALADVTSGDAGIATLPGLGYAVAYPFGIMGIILTMLLIRVLFRVNTPKEAEDLRQKLEQGMEPLEVTNLIVENPNLEGLRLGEISLFEDAGVVISRVRHGDQQAIAHADTILHLGDIVLAVGPKAKLHALKLLVGKKTDVDLSAVPSNITSRTLIVTKKGVLGKTAHELGLRARYEVQITRVRRSGLELPVSPTLRFQYGDRVVAVGEPQRIEQIASLLGNSEKALNTPEIIPIFVGVALGVLVGSWPFHFPGVPAPVKLGLAGGPLLVAIILSRIGKIGPLVWYLPSSANFILREVGIVLFLSCVGLKAGDQFVATLVQGDGLRWMAFASLITIIPLVVVGLVARLFLKTNFLTICGLLAGSMTDPPALAFAGNITNSEAPTVSYAAVYPLTMILRVILAQLIVLLFMR